MVFNIENTYYVMLFCIQVFFVVGVVVSMYALFRGFHWAMVAIWMRIRLNNQLKRTWLRIKNNNDNYPNKPMPQPETYRLTRHFCRTPFLKI